MIASKKKWTYQDYLTLDNNRRCEVVKGDLIVAHIPNFNHQSISRNLFKKLDNYVESKNLGIVRYAPLDVILDDLNVVQPDIIFVANENAGIIKDRIFGSPDLIIEIISPYNASIDRKHKYNIYETYKVKEYWIIDPLYNAIEVYILKGDNYCRHCYVENDGVVTSIVITGFEVDINDVM